MFLHSISSLVIFEMRSVFPVIVGLNSYISHLNSVLTLRKENRPTVFENKVLRNIFGLKRDKVREGEEEHVKWSFITGTAHHILFG
jgi:hypothetical protein